MLGNMAYTNEQLTALQDAIAQGALTVRLNNRQVTYRSLDEMQRLRDTMRAELGIASNRSRFISIPTGKGL